MKVNRTLLLIDTLIALTLAVLVFVVGVLLLHLLSDDPVPDPNREGGPLPRTTSTATTVPTLAVQRHRARWDQFPTRDSRRVPTRDQ